MLGDACSQNAEEGEIVKGKHVIGALLVMINTSLHDALLNIPNCKNDHSFRTLCHSELIRHADKTMVELAEAKDLKIE